MYHIALKKKDVLKRVLRGRMYVFNDAGYFFLLVMVMVVTFKKKKTERKKAQGGGADIEFNLNDQCIQPTEILPS